MGKQKSAEGARTERLESRTFLASPRMLRDVLSNGVDPQNIVATSGGRVFFTADDLTHGRELWTSDGTAAGTKQIVDLNPGAASSELRALTTIGETLYFSADAGSRTGLFKSDGTSAGTIQLLSTFAPRHITGAGNTLFFADSANSLWKSNGTTAGSAKVLTLTDPIKAIFAAGEGRCFVTTRAEGGAGVLWYSDGTTSGTIPVSQTTNSYDSSGEIVPDVAVGNGRAYWLKLSNKGGLYDLWSSTGGSAAPQRLLQALYFPRLITVTSTGSAFFLARARDLTGDYMFVSNGTLNGTSAVSGLKLSASHAFDANAFAEAEGQTYFSLGPQLWVSDGTASGTRMAIDKLQTISSSSQELEAVGEALYLAASNRPSALSKSDGTLDGTVNIPSSPKIAQGLTRAGNRLFFAGDDGRGRHLWITDGTSTGTRVLSEGSGPSEGSNPRLFAEFNGETYFTANSRLWRSDGTNPGTVPTPLNLTALGLSELVGGRGALYAISVGSLLKIDPLLGRVEYLANFDRDSQTNLPLIPSSLTRIGRFIYFTVRPHQTDRLTLWRTDGTSKGTRQVGGVTLTSDRFAVASSGLIFFRGYDDANGHKLWVTDGTTAGTRRIDTSGASPDNFVAVGSTVYFSAATSKRGRELWRSDGTPEGTAIVRDVASGTESSKPDELTELNGKVVFSAFTPATGIELWLTDPQGGARLLADLDPRPGEGSMPRELTRVGNRVFFVADDETGTQLWVTDGTTSHPQNLMFLSSNDDEDARQLTAAGGKLYFVHSTRRQLNHPYAGANPELYTSDGTASGTKKITIASDDAFASPHDLTEINGALYFAANDSVYGDEPWIIDAPPASIRGTVFLDRDGDRRKDADDPARSNVRVFVDRDGDGVWDSAIEQSSITDATGGYAFDSLLPGTYRVQVVPPSGTRSQGPGAFQTTAAAGETTDRDFALTNTAAIIGKVFMDADRDGSFDALEAGLSGWQVFADLNGDGLMTAGEPSAVTDLSGIYAIAVPDATYNLLLVQQFGYKRTSPSGGVLRVIAGAGQIIFAPEFGQKRSN